MEKRIVKGASLFFLFLLLTACGGTRTAVQKEKLSADIAQAVEMPDFTFKATYAYPTGFRSLYLSPFYDVRVTTDTIEAYLPYYGRAYTASINSREGGYRFTSTRFEYQVNAGKKKGNWEAVVTLHDLDRPVTFRFDIWGNGTARLHVTDVNRQSISFQGDIITKSDL